MKTLGAPMPHKRTPPCPRCQAATSWRRSSQADIIVTHAYECPECAFIHITVEYPTDDVEELSE